MINVLIVEDDNEINNLLNNILKDKGYNVVQAFSGTEAMIYINNNEFQIILLDLMLPGLSGEEIIQKVREKYNAAIIVLSAKDSIESKVNALHLGADDYVVKPFDITEILARVEANLRRIFGIAPKNKIMVYKDIELNSVDHKVFAAKKELQLTPKEFSILELMIKNPKKVFSKSNIFESVWNEEFLGDDNAVNVHVSNLRTKLNNATSNNYIKTVWGVGFKLED